MNNIIRKISKIISIVVCAMIAVTVLSGCDKDKKVKLERANVGDTIFFGEYEQDGNKSNGKEEIEWIVLDVQKDKMLLISKYVLDGQPYDESSDDDVMWRDCTLRSWLNSEFKNSAFSKKEKNIIPKVTLSDSDYSKNMDESTRDKIFLLSEIETYSYSRYLEESYVTEYAGNQVSSYMAGECFWWLRSDGTNKYHAPMMAPGGEVVQFFDNSNTQAQGVRPALWVEIK